MLTELLAIPSKSFLLGQNYFEALKVGGGDGGLGVGFTDVNIP